ncbi:gag-protease polyprotein [Trifolium repens]|nr:gag-protease polyprotein [Trifolium repens]
MKVEELIGSLLTYEIAINERTYKKAKSIAFVTNTEDEEVQGYLDTEESITDALVLLGRQLNKVMKRADGRQKPDGQNIRFNISKQQTNLNETRTDEKSNQPKDVQCHECEGYGHIRPECPTFLRRQKKGLVVSWSDGDSSEGEDNGESAKHVSALTGLHISDDDGVMSYDDLVATYKDLLIEHNEVCRVLEKQKKTISQLLAEKNSQSDKLSEAHNEVTQLNSQMDELKKRVSQLNPDTDFLVKMLGEVPTERANSIGYDYKVLNKLQQSRETKFKPDEEVINPYTGEKMPQHPIQHSDKYPRPQSMQHPKSHSHARKHKKRPKSWVCHHCGRKGHIRPYCFKLYGYPKWFHQLEHGPEVQSAKKEWKPKSEETGLIAHTSLRVSSREDCEGGKTQEGGVELCF